MSDWKGHLIFGFVFTAVFFLLINHFEALTWSDLKFFLYTPVLFFFILLPDLDSDSSVIRRVVNVLGVSLVLGCMIGYYFTKNLFFLFGAVTTLLVLLLAWGFTHRGWMHSFVAALILSLPLLIGYNIETDTFFLNYMLFLMGFAGYTSHLIMDGEFKVV